MQKRLILDGPNFDITLNRLCEQLIESHGHFEDSVIIGLQPRGIYVAERIKARLQDLVDNPIHLGHLDITFYRDDFRRRDTPKRANETRIPFIIENKKVVLVDDVLYTGRSVRAALDAMIAFGRPSKVELLVLIDRKFSRQLPIEPNYVGKRVNTMHSQVVEVDWREQGHKKDKIWLIDKED